MDLPYSAGAAEQVRQTRQLPDQCFDKPWYTCQRQAALSVLLCGYIATYWGPGSRESLFTSPVALQQNLKCLEDTLSGRLLSTMVNFANNKLVTC